MQEQRGVDKTPDQVEKARIILRMGGQPDGRDEGHGHTTLSRISPKRSTDSKIIVAVFFVILAIDMVASVGVGAPAFVVLAGFPRRMTTSMSNMRTSTCDFPSAIL